MRQPSRRDRRPNHERSSSQQANEPGAWLTWPTVEQVCRLNLRPPSVWQVFLAVLLTSARYGGREARLEVADLARLTGLGERTVQAALTRLLRQGLLIREGRYGRLKVQLERANPPSPDTNNRAHPSAETPPAGGADKPAPPRRSQACASPTGAKIRMAGCRADPLWCLADWCQMLGYADVLGAVFDWVPRLDQERLRRIVPSPKEGSETQWHERVYVRDLELFQVILGCQLPTAKPFQEWLRDEVLPSIEEHDYYPPPSVQQAAYQRWLAWFDACFPLHYEAVCRERPGGFSVLTAVRAPLLAIAAELIREGLPVEFDDRPDRIVTAWWHE